MCWSDFFENPLFSLEIGCSTLDSSCIQCNSSMTCQACSGGLLALGGTCVASCPSGTYNGTTECICNSLNREGIIY